MLPLKYKTPSHGSGGKSKASQLEGPISNPDQPMYDLWWKISTGTWLSLSASIFPVRIIPPFVNTHISLIYHQHYTGLATGSVVK
jgi:hypothetical protein